MKKELNVGKLYKIKSNLVKNGDVICFAHFFNIKYPYNTIEKLQKGELIFVLEMKKIPAHCYKVLYKNKIGLIFSQPYINLTLLEEE